MRAIVQDRYGDTEVLRLEEVERPEPGREQVLIRVRAAGVDPGVWHVMAGRPLGVRPAFGIRGPRQRTRGTDVAGIVEAVGPGVTRFAPGDEVFGVAAGSFADFTLASSEKGLAPKPAGVSFAEAAVIPISGCTALQGLRAGGLAAGTRVLVLGASGGVGSFAVQLAKVVGAHVTGVASADKLDLVSDLGADEVLDYTRQDPVDGTRRYDLILDTGGNRPLRELRRALTAEGSLVIVGGEGGRGLLGGFERAMLAAPALSLVTRQRLRGLMAVTRHDDLVTLTEWVEASRVRAPLDRTFPLGEAADAIRYLHAGKVRGKIAITI
ncbi:NAD(P)-dependent alcohol dehydrogenase [Arthrobacter sp. Soc17.1.1.1]|uniref:NAD(P)-dependent alcohol dehydrogenase n=1 Tax=Arthrobacter sp. Soc17.1.1.1 TaxID=3121277 RepID=UPI002FE4DD65